MSFDDRLEVPAAKSDFSTRATLYPREAASRATPAPVIPPPTTTRSKLSRSIEARASARGITAGTLRSLRAPAAQVPLSPVGVGPGGGGRSHARRPEHPPPSGPPACAALPVCAN